MVLSGKMSTILYIVLVYCYQRIYPFGRSLKASSFCELPFSRSSFRFLYLRVIIVITLKTSKIPITDPAIPTVITTTLFSNLFSPYDPGNPVVIVECVVIGVVVDSVVVCGVEDTVVVVDSVVLCGVVDPVVVCGVEDTVVVVDSVVVGLVVDSVVRVVVDPVVVCVVVDPVVVCGVEDTVVVVDSVVVIKSAKK